MKKQTGVLLSILIVTALGFTSCKKENGSPATPVTPAKPAADTSFTSFIKFSDVLTTGQQLRGMDYHPGTKNLYFYVYKSGITGYSILQLNTETKQALTVFTFNDSKWNSNNGSEGSRIRVSGNDLYVMGGANNTDIHKLTGIGNNSLTLAKIIKMPLYSGATLPFWGESYDVAIADKLYVMTMRDKITFGNFTDLSNPGSYPVSYSSHGASIVYAAINGNAYLVSKEGANNDILSVRNPLNGSFLRSVTIGPNNRTSLAKDSKERIYTIDNDKILRFTADLLSKESFKATNSLTYYQFALAEENNFIKFYTISSAEINTMKIPL